jgi:prepilin-type N-terminal cleavage/methylation domain-containing protein
MTKRTGPRGMTMVEIMMVIAIIGALAALAVPNLIRLVRNSKVVGDARDLQTLLSSMRAQSMTRGFPMVACLRGRAWVGAEGIARQAFTYRKGTPLLPPVCVAGPCPAAVVDPAVPDYSPAAVPPDMRSVDLILEDQVSWTLPVADDRTFQFVYDMEGNVTAWESTQCALGAAHAPVAPVPLGAPMTGNGWALTLRSDADVTITQIVAVRTDGMVLLP